jgi:hypothetical protein
MNDIKTAAVDAQPARPSPEYQQPGPWHAAPAAFDAEAMAAVCDSGRIRIGAAFRLVTRR